MAHNDNDVSLLINAAIVKKVGPRLFELAPVRLRTDVGSHDLGPAFLTTLAVHEPGLEKLPCKYITITKDWKQLRHSYILALISKSFR